jgi:valyl-tRNA synthetase
MLDKTYDAQAIEPRIARKWEEADAFRAGAGTGSDADPFCIVIPPPNVTGSLHMGHALNNTLQDIMVRFERMRGKSVLWQPGLDHAGIATQMVVERQLRDRHEPGRRDMGRDAFIERVWEWKAESGGMILNQLRRLGASCDWSRERFTMDEGLSKAVTKVFVQLFKEGLIYKDKRLVNWDPKLLTAISDLEVEQIEVKGNLWHFRYPLADDVTYRHPYALDAEGNRRDWKPSDGEPAGHEERDYLVVATTRPETMLGDTGVAVHPDDPRYRDLVGKDVILPLVGRRIPVVADEYPDPEAGTGAVKMTPAHDFNDFDVGKRRNLPAINMLTIEANVTLDDPAFFERLDAAAASSGLALEREALKGELDCVERLEARKRVVSMMEERGLLDCVVPHLHMVPHGDRGGVPIEPYLTDQWYVNAAELAKPAIASVREGRTDFVPKTWENTYFSWMENIQPWCISRQLWWGHQIPAWYGPDGTVFVEEDEEVALEAAIQHYLAHEGPWKAWVQEKIEDFRPGEIITRDEDVLDTWFSSALWPFSTLGWPDRTPELDRYYPTSVLVTGFDIIFFWVARMMMMGLHFMKEEPFATVYVHALVRDKNGAKMSKSKGNVIDPLELIDEYGADALRFTLAILAAQGRDVKLDPARIAGYRNFGTKLWNAVRFAGMNGVAGAQDFEPADAKLTINRWILSELSATVRETTASIERFRFNDAAGVVYKFVWHSFCDWYLELLKPVFSGEDKAAARESRLCVAHVLDEVLKLLHPFMPFMTEELWENTAGAGGRSTLLCHAVWPAPDFEDAQAAAEINWLVELVSEIRSVRAEMNVKPAQILPLVVVDANETTRARLARHAPAIERLARVDPVSLGHEAPKASAQIVIGEATACLPLEGAIDFDAERARVEKEVKRLDGEISRLKGKLGNAKFVANAPEDVVAEEREKLAGYEAQMERTRTALSRIR